MSVLSDLTDALASGAVEIVDLTARLTAETPVIRCRPSSGRPRGSSSRRSAGTTTAGRRGTGTTSAAASTPAPTSTPPTTGSPAATAATSPTSRSVAADPAGGGARLQRASAPPTPTSCSRSTTSAPGRRSTAPLPDGGWMLYRTGWDARSDSQERFINADETGPHTPGMSTECARWVAEEAPVVGVGVETVGTDAGAAHSFDPAFPCHSFLMGSGKYGLTQLQNLALAPRHRRRPGRRAAADRHRLRVSGARRGAGRALTEVGREGRRRRRAGAGRRPASTTSSASSAPGTSTSPTRWWPRARGSSPPGTRAARPRWPTPTPASRAGSPRSPSTRAAG